MLGILRTLTYGAKIKLVEGSVSGPPLDREDIETWVTKSEEKNERLGKREKHRKAAEQEQSMISEEKENDSMVKTTPGTTDQCTPPQERGYISVDIPKIPRKTSLYWFESCCCEDDAAAALEALYQFVLIKKAANPAILKVLKKFSPNQACNVLQVDFNLLGLTPQTETDMKDIWLKYIALLVL